jgi:hypothetical protein
VAVIGWGAALAAIAPSAGAAASQASSTTYNSQASATIASLTVLDSTTNLFQVNANDSNSPQSNSIGLSTLTKALPASLNATIASALGGALNAANAALPNGLDVVTEEATANPDGTSTGCAAILAGDCTTSPHPIVLKIGLGDLSSLLGATPLASLLSSAPQLPTSLADYNLVLTLNGPTAACTAGPAGTGLSAYANLATVSVDIQTSKGVSILKTPVTVSPDQTLKQVLSTLASSPAGTLLATVNGILPISLDSESISHSTSGGVAKAEVLGVALRLGGQTIVGADVVKVSCGANTAAAVTPSSPSGEKPLGAITTDLGRSSVPAADSYLALNGMP